MGSLYRSGHIQSLAIKATTTPADIDIAVKGAFSGVDALENSDIIGVCFPRCLMEKDSGLTFTPTRKQETSHYKILNGRSVLLNFWCYRLYFVTRSHETSHRQAKQFKRVVYVTFSEYSVDLKLVNDGSSVSEISQDSDMDMRLETAQEDSCPDPMVSLPLTCVCHD